MDFQAFKKQFDAQIYQDYKVTLHLIDIAGGTPADPKMIDGWIAATNKEKTDEERKKLVEATKEELPEIAEGKQTQAWVRLKQDETGAYIEGRCLKAALKEAANIIKSRVKVPGKNGEEKAATALKSKVAETVFVMDEKIYLRNGDGKPITGDPPTEERPVHVMTRQGPRTSIKVTDVLRDVHIEFTVRVAQTGAVTERALFSAIAYLENLGIGGDRSQGRGRAKHMNVVKIEK